MADNFDLFGGTLPEISLPTRHTARESWFNRGFNSLITVLFYEVKRDYIEMSTVYSLNISLCCQMF